jgi:hypothetical protein
MAVIAARRFVFGTRDCWDLTVLSVLYHADYKRGRIQIETMEDSDFYNFLLFFGDEDEWALSMPSGSDAMDKEFTEMGIDLEQLIKYNQS